MDTQKIISKILLWIQKVSGQINSWAWTEWSKRNRDQGAWLKGYKKWKKKDSTHPRAIDGYGE